MKTLLVGDCSPDTTFRMKDPDAFSESEFEYFVVQALTCAYPMYRCVTFTGTFRHEEAGSRRPDLALVANDFSHWFVIEVELASHSLDLHVLPQVRAFAYGEPQGDCVTSLANSLGIDRTRAATLVSLVPFSVAVVVNRMDEQWQHALRALAAQMLVVTLFEAAAGGASAAEVDGDLSVISQSLGFGVYSETDRSFRFKHSIALPRGDIQLVDDSGAVGTWRVAESDGAVWVTKIVGRPTFRHNAHAQVVRSYDGKLQIRLPRG